MQSQFEPASGTRDFLAADFEEREQAFGIIRSVFLRYGYEPLQTPAFERLDVLLGKYGEDGDKLVFKILRRGEHEASGEADLALRYDLTVPLARVAAAYEGRLPSPYKRYAMGPVWRADRPGRGRFREFVQCDLDTLGSTSLLADAEAVSAQHDALAELGIGDFTILLNSRHVLSGLLEVFRVPAELGSRVLISLDKLDKLAADEVAAELVDRGLGKPEAFELVDMMTAPDAVDRIRAALQPSEEGVAGLDEVDGLLALVGPQVPAGRIAFTPRMVRGLSYYTGPIWEVVAPGVPGSIALGRPLRPPDRPARRARRARHRLVAGYRADPGPAAVQLGAAARAAGRGRHDHGRGPGRGVVRAGRGGPLGRAAGQRLPGGVRQAEQAAALGRGAGCALVPDLRPP